MSEWQPIETSPKDGTRFVAFGVFGGEPGYARDEMAAFFCKYVGGSLQIDQPTGRYFSGAWPTHWMPLPPPPEAK